MTTLIILNEEMNDVMKIIKSLEKSGLLIKRVSESIEKTGFFSMLLGTLDTSLSGNLFTGKGFKVGLSLSQKIHFDLLQ